jgi:hypothetical protein
VKRESKRVKEKKGGEERRGEGDLSFVFE